MTWASIDRHAPRSVTIDGPGDAAIGTWRDADGARHTSRAYFTFDLTDRIGGQIAYAQLTLQQTGATNCRLKPAFEVSRTDEVTPASSWRQPPAVRQQLTGRHVEDGTPCPGQLHLIDVADAVQGAVDEGRSVVTLAVRLPEDVEGEARRSVWIANAPELTVSAPELRQPIIDGTAEGIDLPNEITLRPGVGMTGVVRWIWKLQNTEDDEGETHVVDAGPDGTAVITVTLTKPGLYYFSVSGLMANGQAAGEGSTYFEATSRPVVTSGTYLVDRPEGVGGGGVGESGDFTFRPRSPDAVAYRYEFNNEGEQRVDATDGSATVRWAPSWPGRNVVSVFTIDSAGKESEEGRYYFDVAGRTPWVSSEDYPGRGRNGGRGVPGTFTFGPGNVELVTRYAFRLNGGAEQIVQADRQGNAATTFPPSRAGRHEMVVRSITRSGERSEPTTYVFYVANRPFVTGGIYQFDSSPSGRPGLADVFTITTDQADMPRVERFVWSIDGVGGEVAADSAGTARVEFTPSRAGRHLMRVEAVKADGTRSDPFESDFDVTNPEPVVWSNIYDAWNPAGGVGVPGQFWIDSAVYGYTQVTIRFNDGPATVVPAGEPVELTPDRAGPNTLSVELRWPDGYTAEGSWTFLVAE